MLPTVSKALGQRAFLLVHQIRGSQLFLCTSLTRGARDNRVGDDACVKVAAEVDYKKESAAVMFRRSATFDADKPKTLDDLWSSPTYPVGFKIPEQQKDDEETLRIDPKSTSVVLFPGQGSQFVGMGRELLQYPNVREMFQRASEILRYNLESLCFEGPKAELNRTVHCQAAVMVTSLAAVERLRALQPWAIENCVATAGFSVGEYAALVFSQAISFEDGELSQVFFLPCHGLLCGSLNNKDSCVGLAGWRTLNSIEDSCSVVMVNNG